MKINKQLFMLTCLGMLLFLPKLKAQDRIAVVKLGMSSVDHKEWGELLFGYGSFDSNSLIWGPSIGLAAGFEFAHKEFSPKVSLGATWSAIFTTSLNVNYHHRRGQRFVFTPEIGINALKVLHLTYGYQFNQVSFEEGNPNVSKHRLSFFITIPIPLD